MASVGLCYRWWKVELLLGEAEHLASLEQVEEPERGDKNNLRSGSGQRDSSDVVLKVLLTLAFFLSGNSVMQGMVILGGSVLLLFQNSWISWLLHGEGSEPPSSGLRHISESASNSGSNIGSSRRGCGSGRGGRSQRELGTSAWS